MFTSLKSLLTLGLLAGAVHAAPALAQGNPLDRVGIEHNVYLACLVHNGATEGVEPLVAVVEICGFRPGTSTEEFVARYAAFAQVDPYAGVAQNLAPYRDAYNDQQFAYFEQIDRVLRMATDEAGADAAFARLEASAVAQLRSGSPADQSVLAALSTARHSLRYWSATVATAGGRTGAAKSSKRRFWDVLMVVGADLLGAAGGTLIGGPVLGGVIGAASSAGAADVLG